MAYTKTNNPVSIPVHCTTCAHVDHRPAMRHHADSPCQSGGPPLRSTPRTSTRTSARTSQSAHLEPQCTDRGYILLIGPYMDPPRWNWKTAPPMAPSSANQSRRDQSLLLVISVSSTRTSPLLKSSTTFPVSECSASSRRGSVSGSTRYCGESGQRRGSGRGGRGEAKEAPWQTAPRRR